MFEAPPVDWSVEEEFSEGMETLSPEDIIDKEVDDFPEALKEVYWSRRRPFWE